MMMAESVVIGGRCIQTKYGKNQWHNHNFAIYPNLSRLTSQESGIFFKSFSESLMWETLKDGCWFLTRGVIIGFKPFLWKDYPSDGTILGLTTSLNMTGVDSFWNFDFTDQLLSFLTELLVLQYVDMIWPWNFLKCVSLTKEVD